MAFNFNLKSDMLQNIKHFEFLGVGTPKTKQTKHPDFEAILALRLSDGSDTTYT